MPRSAPVEVVVRPDGLSAVLRAPGGRDRGDVCRALCAALLEGAGVSSAAIDWKAVEAFARDCLAADPEAPVEREVARGTPAIDGAPGHIEIIEPERVERADDGTTDHHAARRFRGVHAGARIGSVVDPTPGEDGVTVRGGVIAAKRGAPARIQVHASVIRRDAGLFAAHDGVLEATETSVCVLPEVNIPGCVDFSTGNLEAPCDVRVAEGVRDGFVVDVDGSAEIGGLVEAATVRTGRDARLAGGMAARGKGALLVGRDLTARYLDHVRGSVDRDAIVEREILNCELSVGRNLDAARGQILGGEVSVAGVCEVDSIGSEAGVPTRVMIGRCPKVETMLSRVRTMRGPIEVRQQKVALEHLQMNALSGPRLTAAQAERSTELEYEITMLAGFLKKLDAACDTLLEIARKSARARLKVTRRVCPKTTVVIGAYTAEFRRELRGPVVISLNDTGRGIVTNLTDGSVVPLNEVAVVEYDKEAVTVLP